MAPLKAPRWIHPGFPSPNSSLIRSDATSQSTSSPSIDPYDPLGGPPEPIIYQDDSLSYAMRLQGEFDHEDRALAAERINLPHIVQLSYAERLRNELFDHEDRALAAERVNLPNIVQLSYAERLQKEFDNEDRALSADCIKLSHTVRQVFKCGICMEELPEDSVARPDPCGHSFCRDCMRGYVSSRLEERRFPILCPTCTASKGKGKTVTGGTPMFLSPLSKTLMDVVEVSQALALNLGLTDEQFNIWTEMEMVSFSVLMYCRKYSTPIVSTLCLLIVETGVRGPCSWRERNMKGPKSSHARSRTATMLGANSVSRRSTLVGHRTLATARRNYINL